MTEQPPLPLPPPAAPAARPVARSRPWWAKLIGRFLAPWIEIKREPTVPPFTLDRPVCYVLEDYESRCKSLIRISTLTPAR